MTVVQDVEKLGCCPVCGDSNLQPLETHHVEGLAHHFTKHACQQCEVDHWRPLIHPGPEFYEAEKVPIYRAMHEDERSNDPRFTRFFELFEPVGGRFLDVGCSDGTFLAMARARGNEVVGIDIDQRALAVAKRRGIEASNALIGDFVESALSSGKRFDFITVFDVVEHLTDPTLELRRLASILAPGGRIVGTVPNKHRVLAREMSIDFPPHHFFRFGRRGLSNTLRFADLQVQRLEVFQYNYSAQTALSIALRGLRPAPRPMEAATQGAAEASAPSRRSPPSPARRLRKALVSLAEKAVSPISYAMELPAARGFKLFFVATPSKS